MLNCGLGVILRREKCLLPATISLSPFSYLFVTNPNPLGQGAASQPSPELLIPPPRGWPRPAPPRPWSCRDLGAGPLLALL